MKKLILITSLIILFLNVNKISYSQYQFMPNKTIQVIENMDTLDFPWAGGLSHSQFSRIDLDNDGIEDLLVYDRSDLRASTFLNKGTPGNIKFEYAPEYEQYIPKAQGWMLLRDYNCDGKKDVFAGFAGRIEVHLNVSVPGGKPKFKKMVHSVNSYQPPSGTFGIYISSDDIPAIYDVDGDGDLDILAFGIFGIYLEYNKNLSIETYGNCDSLNYEIKNLCWGHFAEIGVATNKLKLFDTCTQNVFIPEDGGVGRHVGSTVTAFDNNGDGVTDVLLGDVTFNNIVLGEKDSTGGGINTSIIIQDTIFPSYDTSVDIVIFPGTYLEDMDNDGIKDMLVSPNTTELAENLESIWFYKNYGANNLPVFKLRNRDFMQDEMINTGESAIPVLFDYNADGKLDLIVSNYGFFNRDSATYDNQIYLYKNIGTTSLPTYKLITKDYQNIAALKLGTSLHPTFGDLDNDGDQDMILGNSEGTLFLFTNSAGAGNTAVFNFIDTMEDNLTTTIDVGHFSAPQLFDFDNDNDLDLVLGKMTGTISYYENTGTISSHTFTKRTDTLGGIEIHEYWDIYGAATGFSTPQFYKDSGTLVLYCGGHQGEIYKFSGLNTSNPIQAYTNLDTVFDSSQIGLRTVPEVYDLGKDGKLDIFIGNRRGGVRLFTKGVNTWSVNELEGNKIDFNIYPNPTNNVLNVKLNYFSSNINSIKIHNILGEEVLNKHTKKSETSINVTDFAKGMYFITVSDKNSRRTKRFVVR